MILSGNKILEEVKNKRIVIKPLILRNLNPNSYNFTLGNKYIIANNLVNHEQKSLILPKTGFQLRPGNLYLMNTNEIIGSKYYVVSLIGRSSLGRMGVFITLSTDLGNLGKHHKWTLEIYCIQPIVVYPGMKIGQVSFWEPHGEIVEYSGQYANYNCPCISIYVNI